SHYYDYSQLIRRNQLSPIVSENFEKPVTDEKIVMKFPFTLYGSNISTFSVDNSGVIFFYGEGAYGLVQNSVSSKFHCETEISDRGDTIKIMNVIHSNGKIYFYYENIIKNDEDDRDFKENGCRNKSSIVEVSSEPTTVATTETDLRNELKETSGSNESHLNMTTDTTTDIEKRKSPQY
ncbi:unnamed protein product, partial [Schistosoma curassoni]